RAGDALQFTVEREVIEKVVYAPEVVEVHDPIYEREDNLIQIPFFEMNEGDILLGTTSEGEMAAYRVVELLEEGMAEVEIPAVDEIFDEIDIYGTYFFDPNDIVTNPDLEVEIIQNLKNSSFFEGLIQTAYAADTPNKAAIKTKIDPDLANRSVDIELIITLSPGETGLFGMEKLKNHEITLTLKTSIQLSTNVDIQKFTRWDVSGTAHSTFSWEIKFDIIVHKDEGNTALDHLFPDKDTYASYDAYHMNKQYQDAMKEITTQLNKLTEDISNGEIKLFDWTIPITTGVLVEAEIFMFTEFQVTASLSLGQEIATVFTVGLRYDSNGFSPYSNKYQDFGEIALNFKGKIEMKGGAKIEIGAIVGSKSCFYLMFDPQVGLYSEVYATIPLYTSDKDSDAKFAYSYFEPGAYFSASVKSYVNLLVEKIACSYDLIEVQFPFTDMILGTTEIVTGISTSANTISATDKTFEAPEIMLEYYDVKAGLHQTKFLSADELKFFTTTGETLTVTDGMITLPEDQSATGYVTASYLHEGQKVYTTMFRVLVEGSILEGKVSAYDPENQAARALEGAKITLYSATGDTPLSTQAADSDGKFSFLIGGGDYRLVIEANGYHNLTTSQSIGDGEIKYTEHLLLLDSAEQGNGSAGGRLTNALTGQGVSGASLRLRTSWNNTSGETLPIESTTTSNGAYSFTDLPVGYYTVEGSLDGYVTGYTNIMVLSSQTVQDFDFTITPMLEGNDIRIVLTWGASPQDLDSYLIGRTPDGSSFNISYRNKNYIYQQVPMANLDVDDTSQYGPETVTITENVFGKYTYAVHDYSNRSSSASTGLSYSSAVVRVFQGSQQIGEFHVPADQIGTYWTVFQIDNNGAIYPINTLSNTAPVA
ncbi:MAG: carboxypeptidase regulatory-like domain-containing protein, partial [Eubacteriales bacterium]